MGGAYRLRAVSPVIATLLLIAIAVAAGIILYVFVSGFVQSLTTANPAQAGENLALVAYDWRARDSTDDDVDNALFITLRNTGPAPLRIARGLLNNFALTVNPDTGTGSDPCAAANTAAGEIFAWNDADGTTANCTDTGENFKDVTPAPPTGNSAFRLTIGSGSETIFMITMPSGIQLRFGQSYVLQIVTESGAVFQFTVIFGRIG